MRVAPFSRATPTGTTFFVGTLAASCCSVLGYEMRSAVVVRLCIGLWPLFVRHTFVLLNNG